MRLRAIRIAGGAGGCVLLAGAIWLAFAFAGLRPDLRIGVPVDRSGARILQASWSDYAGDAGARQYSPVGQIRPGNVAGLKLAWIFRTGEMRQHAAQMGESSFANTPTIAAGNLILCTPWNRVIALDPVTGRERWRFDPRSGIRLMPGMKYVCRGVAAWRDPVADAKAPCAERLIFGTNDFRIFAIDAATGRRCAGFGANGAVSMPKEAGEPGIIKFNAPPVIVGNVAIFGSAILDGHEKDRPLGTVRAFDVRTGAPFWTFDPIPQAAGPADGLNWKKGSNIGFGGGNVWADMSVDRERGLVFLPTSSPSVDWYGGQRPGDNRYGDSVVALKAATGEIVWSFQFVHHDIWDYDTPTAPLLTDLEVRGHRVPALVQTTKMGLIFVLDRRTGKPVYPVEERPVPPSLLPGETSWPTQPIPTTMPSVMPYAVNEKNAWGFTPWDRAKCRDLIAQYPVRGLYAPPSREGTIKFPIGAGGSNLGMRSYDPVRKLLIVTSLAIASYSRVVDRPDGDFPYSTTGGMLMSPFGVPCNPPPWGRITAIDLESRKIVWQKPLGTVEKLGPIPVALNLGTPSRGGPITTGGGVTFVAGTMDDAFRAFDTATGAELWKTRLPAGGQATPMTYMINGRQYVVIAAGGHDFMKTTPGDYVLAYALPDHGKTR